MNHVLIGKDNYEDFTAVLPITALPKKDRYTFGAYSDDDVVAGAISFYLIDNQYVIDWLYVAPSMRERGVATELLNEIHRYIKGTGEIYPLIARYEVTEDDMSLYGFFLGRHDMDTDFSHYRYYVSSMDIKTSEGLQGNMETDFTFKNYFSLPNEYQNRYLSQITSTHNFLIEDRNSWKKECIPELCKVVCRGDKLMAAIFITGREDGNLELAYLYSNTPIATKLIVCRAASEIIKKFPGVKLIFDCVGENSEPLARRLFPEAKVVCIYESVW